MIWLFVLFACASAVVPPTCNSRVYCSGPLLHAVQMARIFNDSKSFVDLMMKYPEETVLDNYDALVNETNNNPTKEQLKQFIDENFEEGKELEEWNPPDFIENPKFLDKIQDTELREFGRKIVALWKKLARKVKSDVSQKPNQYSLIYLSRGFIIPGGRFKEIYYWDTYWIIRGLLISEMYDTARGMIENIMHLAKTFGHVPNGSRVYYLQRSQPPLLTKMVKHYLEYRDDKEWLKKHIHILDLELQYWLTYRQIKVKRDGTNYILYQYNAPSWGPRPESYHEDILTAASSVNPNDTYIDLKSGAESGWDFSTRWIFDESGGNNGTLSQISTRRVIPVDLNAILYDAFSSLSKMYISIENFPKAVKWGRHAASLLNSINTVLYNPDQGVWQDYDAKLGKHRDYFYVSNVAPLWVGIHENTTGSPGSMDAIIDYLKREGIEKYPGGTPSSTLRSGEQWDLPNAWPPLQDILITGLDKGSTPESRELAQRLAQLWVNANYRGYEQSHEMFEKYDANVPGQFGGGGEYTVQAGFGWTNGVLLKLLNKYGDILTVET